MQQYHSRFLVCCDCQKDFLFDAGEQAFFASKQLSEPKRCPECRKMRKASLVPDYEVKR